MVVASGVGFAAFELLVQGAFEAIDLRRRVAADGRENRAERPGVAGCEGPGGDPEIKAIGRSQLLFRRRP